MYAIHELSQTVRTRRQEIGLSQQRLATLAGLSRATIVQREGGTLKDLSFTRTALLEVLRLGLTSGLALGPPRRARTCKGERS
jgi:DNA-binding XRE family transcriptional regulator